MKTIINKIVLALLCAFPLILFSQGQPYFSENWSREGGEMAMFYKNTTTTDDLRNVYVAGSTINQLGNHDILIQKFDPKGILLWEHSFNGDANMDDMAADVFVDNEYNVYVTGVAVQSINTSQDLVVLKYNANGVLQWTYFYDNDGSPNPTDVGTAIIGDNEGGIFVTGSSFGSNTMADYVVLKLKSNNGAKVWEKRYDYNGLNEIPAKIDLKGNKLYVSGASQVGPNKWELATLSYHASDGTLLGEKRSVGNATQGVNEINDLTIDDDGNIYLTGAIKNQNSFDIAIYKLDENLNIIWEKQFDGYGNDDKGNGIKVDSQGNVYIAGTIQTNNEGKNYVLIKYTQNGDLLWSREFNGKANSDDEATQLVLNNDRVFITGLAKNTSLSSFQTLVYNEDGTLYTQVEFKNPNLNEIPTGITVDLSGNIIVVGQTGLGNGKYRTRTVKYTLFEKPLEPVFENGEPKYNANEVIIRFDRRAVKYDAIDRRSFTAGMLSDFVQPNVITKMSNKLGFDVSRLETFKIFKRMTTADTISVTRLGDTIKIDDFWTTLSVFFPKKTDILFIRENLKNLNSIHFIEQNYFGKYTDGTRPNDPQFSIYDPQHNHYHVLSQASLTGTLSGINLSSVTTGTDPYFIENKGGWKYETGKSEIKVGIFDTGIRWQHEDLGDGSWSGSRVKGGWDYGKNVHPSSQTNSDPINSSQSNGHGTAVAGIIGAIRNNDTGIAGIAGGNFENEYEEDGVSLYSLRTSTGTLELGDTLFSITTSSEAIVEGSVYNPYTGFGFGLNIQNYSWRIINDHPDIDTILHTLRNAVFCAFKNNTIQVASSGNLGWNETQNADTSFYPASYNNEWILKTGAFTTDGIYPNAYRKRVDYSAFGPNVDILAPGGGAGIVKTLNNTGNSSYKDFSGTSASAPHVSGVAALILSLHNPIYESTYPNRLAMEDVEHLIKKGASPIKKDDFEPNNTLSVPNKYSGYGALNADKSLEISSLPYMVYHFNDSAKISDGSLVAVNQPILFPEGIDNLPIDAQIGSSSIYKITKTFSHSIPNERIYIDGWIRNSSSDLYDSTNIIYNKHWSGSKLINSNSNSATVIGYYYETEIITPDSSYVIINPKPNDNGMFKISYSIYVKDTTIHLGLNEFQNEEDVSIFPNPANNLVNIKSENIPISTINIYDLTGRLVENKNINMKYGVIDISNYPKGIYLFKIEKESGFITKKIIKY